MELPVRMENLRVSLEDTFAYMLPTKDGKIKFFEDRGYPNFPAKVLRVVRGEGEDAEVVAETQPFPVNTSDAVKCLKELPDKAFA